MKKKITLISLLLLIGSNGLSYAETTSINPNAAPIKIAIVSDLLKDAVKSSVYSVGTMLLNKYANSTNYIPIVMPTTNTTTNNTYTPPPITTTTPTDVPPDQPEPMIPIS